MECMEGIFGFEFGLREQLKGGKLVGSVGERSRGPEPGPGQGRKDEDGKEREMKATL